MQKFFEVLNVLCTKLLLVSNKVSSFGSWLLFQKVLNLIIVNTQKQWLFTICKKDTFLKVNERTNTWKLEKFVLLIDLRT